MFKKQKIKSKSGITLVALVVTIVVLLILAGVSLSLVLDNNGIISRAGEAQEQYGQASKNEQKDLDTAADDIDRALGEYDPLKKITSKTLDEAKLDDMLNSTEETKVKFTDGTVVIPKGYKISDATANDVGHGVVIQDGSGNQWVWVPVGEKMLAKMCDTANTEEYKLCGTTDEEPIKAKLYTRTSIEIGTGSNKTTITRGLPGSTSYREPDLVVGSDGKRYDAANCKTIVGNAGTLKEMAELFKDEYETMIKSIEKYGGFYIGRYELSGTVNSPTEKSGTTITNQNWYNLYNACKKLGANADGTDKEGIATRMIWGCQWDATCDFIATKGEEKNIKDSSTWGNYTNYNTANNYTEGTTGYVKDAGTKLDTGTSEYWKANNIYDIAGNCYEWTQEADGAGNRAYRGGKYSSNGSDFPASNRNYFYPTSSDYGYFRFPSHFNNYYWNLERENQWKEGQNRLTENGTKRRRKPLIVNEIRYDGKI